jgi:hypothetical protein
MASEREVYEMPLLVQCECCGRYVKEVSSENFCAHSESGESGRGWMKMCPTCLRDNYDDWAADLEDMRIIVSQYTDEFTKKGIWYRK